MDNLSVTSRLLRLTSTVGILTYCLALHTKSRPLLLALILLAALCVGIHAIFMAGRRLGRIFMYNYWQASCDVGLLNARYRTR